MKLQAFYDIKGVPISMHLAKLVIEKAILGTNYSMQYAARSLVY